MLFVEYPKCTTCKKAKKWLDDHNIEYEDRNIKENNPSESEIREWAEKSGLPMRRFFNISGMLYREMQLKDKLSSMSDDEMIALLAKDGMLVKRPVLIGGDFVLVGFKENEWEEKIIK